MTDGTTLASETLDAPAVRAAADVEYLARAHALRPFVRSQSAAVEQGGTMSPAMVEALKAERIFWMPIPATLGGGGRGLVDSMRVVEEISFADASVGWALMVNLTMTAVASAFVGDAAVDSMFGGKELPVMAGMLTRAARRVMPGTTVELPEAACGAPPAPALQPSHAPHSRSLSALAARRG